MRPNQLTNFNMRIYGQRGERLYLDEAERQRFLRAVGQQEETLKTLCLVLFYTGCRISEALALTPDSLRVAEGVVCLQTLKRRGVFVREVPVPKWLLEKLVRIQPQCSADTNQRFWRMHRATAWRQIKQVMEQAQISGPQATPKGLRHGFGVHAIRCGIPLNLLQRWLGHSQLMTTAVYANASDDTVRPMAMRMWLTD